MRRSPRSRSIWRVASCGRRGYAPTPGCSCSRRICGHGRTTSLSRTIRKTTVISGRAFELDGKRGKRVALADAELQRSQAERSLRIQQIAGNVAASYWTAILAEKTAELLKKDIQDVDAMVRYHQERVDSGAMRGVDLIRMQIERDRLSLSLQGANRDAQLARVELFRQIGRPTHAGDAVQRRLSMPSSRLRSSMPRLPWRSARRSPSLRTNWLPQMPT